MYSIIRLPNIKEGTTDEKVTAISNFLFSLVQELNNREMVSDSSSSTQVVVESDTEGSSDDPLTIFTKIKGYIMKNTDIINAYYTALKKKFDSVYATSDGLDEKVDKVAGKGLSTNDYTNAEKEKLAGLENYDDTQIKEDIAELQDSVTLKNAEVETSIFMFARSCDNGLTPFITTSDTTSLPDGYEDAVGTVHKASSGKIILNLTNTDGDMAVNVYTDSWSGWKYLSPE